MRTILALLAAATLVAAEPSYDLHEWGVFTVAPGNPFAQQDYREEWTSFPAFFIKQAPLPREPKAAMIVRKPVIFLNADGDMKVDLSVTMRGGTPMVWWPDATVTNETLRFAVRIWDKEQAIREKSPERSGPAVPAGHWIEHLRVAGADFLTTTAGDPTARRTSAGWTGDSFLYYDGLLPAMPAPGITILETSGGPQVTVTNTADHPLLDTILIWKRDGKVLVSQWQSTLVPREQAVLKMWPIAPLPPVGGPVDATPKPYDVQLRERLVAAGLKDQEATSLVSCWYDAFFVKGEDGLTLLHRLPQETYESMLPMQALPMPRSTVRVGLVAFTHLEPTLAKDVDALIDRLAQATTEEQPAVIAALKAYGGAAFPMLRARIAANRPEAALCQHLLTAQELARP